jgi:hypothetical protein
MMRWIWSAGLLFLFVPGAAAQPPALQPWLETKTEWTQPPAAAPNERTILIEPHGLANLTAKASFRVFVSGGYIVCQPDTAYKFTIDLLLPPPPYARATLGPEAAKTITAKVPQGPGNGGTPWTTYEGPTLSIAWNMASAKANDTFEYKVGSKGPPTLVGGGCQPDPLKMPARHIVETVNVTKAYVKPVAPVAAPTCNDCRAAAATSGSGASPAPDLALLLPFVALLVMLWRRPPRPVASGP